jgi:hypothetical protein
MQVPWGLRYAATVGKATTAALTAILAIVMTSFASLAASDFVGTWNVKDTADRRSRSHSRATGQRRRAVAREWVGTWREEGKTAVITWKMGWTTKIAKEDDH